MLYFFSCLQWRRAKMALKSIAHLILPELESESNIQAKILKQPVAYPESFRRWYTGLGTQTMCPNY